MLLAPELLQPTLLRQVRNRGIEASSFPPLICPVYALKGGVDSKGGYEQARVRSGAPAPILESQNRQCPRWRPRLEGPRLRFSASEPSPSRSVVCLSRAIRARALR